MKKNERCNKESSCATLASVVKECEELKQKNAELEEKVHEMQAEKLKEIEEQPKQARINVNRTDKALAIMILGGIAVAIFFCYVLYPNIKDKTKNVSGTVISTESEMDFATAAGVSLQMQKTQAEVKQMEKEGKQALMILDLVFPTNGRYYRDANGNTFYKNPACTEPIEEEPIFSSYHYEIFWYKESSTCSYRLASGGIAYIPSNYRVNEQIVDKPSEIMETSVEDALVFVNAILSKGDGKKTYVDQNKNTFYEDPECTIPIKEPKFATLNNFGIMARDSMGRTISIYRLAGGGFAFLPSNFLPYFK